MGINYKQIKKISKERKKKDTDDFFGSRVDDRDPFLKLRLSPVAVDEKLSTRNRNCHFLLSLVCSVKVECTDDNVAIKNISFPFTGDFFLLSFFNR